MFNLEFGPDLDFIMLTILQLYAASDVSGSNGLKSIVVGKLPVIGWRGIELTELWLIYRQYSKIHHFRFHISQPQNTTMIL